MTSIFLAALLSALLPAPMGHASSLSGQTSAVNKLDRSAFVSAPAPIPFVDIWQGGASFYEGTEAKVIYVKQDAAGANNGSSWEDAFTSLQSGLDAAGEGDEIWVASGIYTPTLRTAFSDPRSATFNLKSGVKIFGGFTGSETSRDQRDWRAHPTILSGDLLGDDEGFANNDENSYHVVTALNIDQNARLDGFIIRGGNANSTAPPESYGGGLYASLSSPVLVNLIFMGNFAIQGGGLYNTYSSSLMVNCAWFGNQATFGGGVRNLNSNPTMINAIFDGNVASTIAGGLHNSYSNPLIINATFAYNSDIIGARSILNDNDSVLTIKNSIIWGESGTHILNQTGGSVALYYLLIRDGWGGMSCTQCLDDDPLFMDADGEDDVFGTLDDDLHLGDASKAIDRGDNSAVPPDTLDLDHDGNTSEPLSQDWAGNRRFANSPNEDYGSGTPPLVDLGALEWQNLIYLPLITKS